MLGCATSSQTVKIKYVPVDVPRVVCAGAKIEDGFKQSPYLVSSELPNVETDDDVEILAKVALDDIITMDTAFEDLVAEADKLEERCATEEKDAQAERESTLESIDELNKSQP